MMRFYVVIVMLLTLCMPAQADEEVAPAPYVSSSIEGRYYFKMIPDHQAHFDTEKGLGYAYRVTDGQADELLWSTTRWFSFHTYLSGDGTYLVRLGTWPRGHTPSAKHLAIAFYKEGKQITSYSTEQIIKDTS